MAIRCDLCGAEASDTHLALYVNGSEGIRVCLPCRIALTDFARAIKSACNRTFLRHWKENR
jgi:ribosome-binding protein aMBF1 (putative translation factor)